MYGMCEKEFINICVDCIKNEQINIHKERSYKSTQLLE